MILAFPDKQDKVAKEVLLLDVVFLLGYLEGFMEIGFSSV